MTAIVEANEPLPLPMFKWFTLGQAAKAVGRSKAALSRAVKNGTLSAERQPDGSFKIAASELFRVYRPVEQTEQLQRVNDPAEVNALNRELRAKLDAATQRLTEIKDELADLRDDRNQWREQAQRLALTDQRAKQEPPPVVVLPRPAAAPAPAAAPPAAVKVRPVARTAPAPAKETSWLRRIMGGR